MSAGVPDMKSDYPRTGHTKRRATEWQRAATFPQHSAAAEAGLGHQREARALRPRWRSRKQPEGEKFRKRETRQRPARR